MVQSHYFENVDSYSASCPNSSRQRHRESREDLLFLREKRDRRKEEEEEDLGIWMRVKGRMQIESR